MSQGTEAKETPSPEDFNSSFQSSMNAFLANFAQGGGRFPAIGSPSSSQAAGKGGNKGKKGKKRKDPPSSNKPKNGQRDGSYEKKRVRIEDAIPDSKNRCLDCGEIGHTRMDPNCPNPSWGSRKISEFKEKNGGKAPFLGKRSGNRGDKQA